MELYVLLVCLLGLAASDNSTIGDRSTNENVSEIASAGNNIEMDTVDQSITRGEWTAWSKWSPCTRKCGGGISRQQRRCRRKPCKGRPWKYKVCNPQGCEKPSDFRAEQCAAFDDVPYSGQLLKWYPHYDPDRPCSLICRGEQSLDNAVNRLQRQEAVNERTVQDDAEDDLQFVADETIVVQLADKVEDGTRCYMDGRDVCINGECMKVGCDLRVGSNKNTDSCGVCGGNGSSCQSRYAWSLESISACSKSCGGGFKIAMAVCKTIGQEESMVEDSYCDSANKPKKTHMACNTHPCTTKWISGEWSKCSASCGGGSRTRAVFCTEENGNETTKLPDHKCSGSHKPRSQETCNAISCPMWETGQWSECSASCGSGVRTRTIECRDGNGLISTDCDPSEEPRGEQECKTDVDCSIFSKCYSDGDELTQPFVQPCPPPVPEKLIDQPIPSESTFIAEEWSPCSVTCGEGIRHREVHCKIFLEFSRTIAKLPDRQCSGPKPIETEKCAMGPCGLMENSLSYRIDTVGDSGYADTSLTDSYRSPSGGSAGSYDSDIKIAPSRDGQTTYSWKEAGYTPCSATCLGGVQDLIINCVRDDTGKTVTPFLCTKETKPEARVKTCNDNPCPPRWNYSDFLPCMSPCGIGIQIRDVTCIHEVTRGSGSTVRVPNHLCPQPPPTDRQYCNVLDCPIKWSTEEWSKCSVTCGGGIKKRKVFCEQIMAQGLKQSHDDNKCPDGKPSTEAPCNTRPCHEMGMKVQPKILSQNTTYNQSDPNTNVDLKIGGIAEVFQGTPFIKIRCPVKKFEKSQIVWTKNDVKLQKSKKYKISGKGALRIMTITSHDSGDYVCNAGASHAKTRLIVKLRSKEQISSEEYLRIGNSVHFQRNVNLDSAPANSGESLYTDRAAYGNRFASIDEEDRSHEQSVPSKPTRKPQQKRQKTSPTPPDSTMVHKEYVITSFNQPGYHESVESTATSGASNLVPHISYLISSLKAYWPFQGSTDTRKNHRPAPDSLVEGAHRDALATKRTLSDRKNGLKYQNVGDPFDNLYRNTAIPDETFGPDEERIFIDVDPYDLDEAMFDSRHTESDESANSLARNDLASGVDPNLDYVEESLKNVKRQWQRSQNTYGDRQINNASNARGKVSTVETATTPDDIGLEVFYVQDSTRKEARKKDENDTVETKNSELENSETVVTSDLLDSTISENSEDTTRITDTNNKEKWSEPTNGTPDEFKKRGVSDREGNDTTDEDDVVSEVMIATKELESDEREDSTKPMYESTSILLQRHHPDRDSMDKDEAELKEIAENARNSRKLDTMETTSTFLAFDESNVTHETTSQSVAVLDAAEELIYEWVTTDWSKCSQTCGGSGFQMRGAQCTVRSTKLGNSTRVPPRTVIGAKLCEDAGHPVPQKVRPCGSGRCPQWHTTEWTPCETSRCFNWKTAMQRRDVSCRLAENSEGNRQNLTLLDASKCDDATRPLQRQECYNDDCKGVWRVGEWSECTASCEEDGIKYRILQCVWYGTKKPAGNACRDIPRPPVMKTCRGPPCSVSPDECKDHSQLCSRVKTMNMCRVPLYQKQCCASCP